MRVMIFAEAKQYPNCLHIRGLRQAMEDLHVEGDLYDICHTPTKHEERERAERDIYENPPDLLISCWPMGFESSSLRNALVERRVTCVVWWGDYHKHVPEIQDGGFVKRIYMTNAEEEYWRWFSHHTGMSFEQMRYLPEGTYRFDTLDEVSGRFGHPTIPIQGIGFFGNLSGEAYASRRRVLETLKRERFTVMHFEAFNEEQNRAWLWQPSYWRYAPIMLSMSITAEAHGYTSARLFHLTGSGATTLVEYFPGLDRLFDVVNEVDTFRTPDEAVSRARLLMADPAWRLALGDMAFRRAMRDHTLTDRLRAIFHDMGFLNFTIPNVMAERIQWPRRVGRRAVHS